MSRKSWIVRYGITTLVAITLAAVVGVQSAHAEGAAAGGVQPASVAPQITDDAVRYRWVAAPLTVTLSQLEWTGDDATIHYSIDGGSDTVYAEPIVFSATGEYALSYYGVDPLGTRGPTGSVALYVDADPPVTTSNLDSAWYAAPVSVVLDAGDAITGVSGTYYAIDGGSATEYTGPFTFGGPQSTLEFWSIDAVGNVETHVREAVQVDEVAPTVSLSPEADVVLGIASFEIVAQDDDSGVAQVRWALDGGDVVEGTQVTVDALGAHALQYWATDNAGNESARVVHEFTVRDATVCFEFAGADRSGTSIEVSKHLYPEGASSVVLASGTAWSDAITGAALAGVVDAPLLLTSPGSLDAHVREEILRLGPGKVYILGGARAVSPAIEAEISAALGPEVAFERIAGLDRYGTADAVAAAAVELQGGSFAGTAFVATGRGYADSLSAAPLAAAFGWPVFLSGPAGLSASTIAAMHDAGVTDVVILGGTRAVPAGVTEQLAREGLSSTRLQGSNRYETSLEVARYGVAAGLEWDCLALASGERFADALAGGICQGECGSVLLLTSSTSLDPAVAAGLAEVADTISEVRFLGGTAVVSQTVRDEVGAILW